MRYLVMVKYNENAVPPPQALLDALAKNRQEAKLAGVLVAVGGLFPSAVGARVRLTGEEEKVEEEKVSGKKRCQEPFSSIKEEKVSGTFFIN